MLVESLNNDKTSGETELTVLGPFYVADAAALRERPQHLPGRQGSRRSVEGRVTDAEGRPIAGATLDVWQTNEEGFYDVQQKGVQPCMNLRGVFTSNAKGGYWFRTAYPRFYPIPTTARRRHADGAGQRLDPRGAYPFHRVRAGYEDVVTHVFPPDARTWKGRGVRREGKPDRRLQTQPRHRRRRTARLLCSVLDAGLGFRPGKNRAGVSHLISQIAELRRL